MWHPAPQPRCPTLWTTVPTQVDFIICGATKALKYLSSMTPSPLHNLQWAFHRPCFFLNEDIKYWKDSRPYEVHIFPNWMVKIALVLFYQSKNIHLAQTKSLHWTPQHRKWGLPCFGSSNNICRNSPVYIVLSSCNNHVRIQQDG